MVRTLRFFSAVAAALLVSSTALADVPSPNKGAANKEARDKVHEEKKDLKEAKKELREARKEGDAGAAEEAKKDVKEAKKELSEAQKERRKAHMAEMRAKWGTILKMDGVKEEMRTHASRMARLRRVEKVATEKKKEATVKRAQAALEKEKARHDKKMAELKTKGGGDAGAAAAATGGAK
jgi:hypothetical protein